MRCSTTTVTSTDGTVTTTSCSTSQTRIFTARDACGNTATASRTVTWTADHKSSGDHDTGAIYNAWL